ncbi:zinc-finger homeodomain protein 6-like [Mangifera indica]|uniref:zinc-finger homeodomain protein 6-like n=1 Tax=Mangifera indica TaxID=29780 RepID=UPI001CFA42BC|nr:zinc-finger homeodomain protein 6-like [Mangifera indica]
MELRDQDAEIGMPSSLVHNRASSSKVSSTPINSAVGETRRDHQTSNHVHGDVIFNSPQALDQHPLLFTQLNPHQNIHKQTRRDLDIDSDPVPTTDVQVSSRSNVRQPQPLQAPPPAAATAVVPSVRYRECQKNHAANMGGQVMDGCGEFMPGGEEGTAEALKCAACECHRSFHRREVDGEPQLYPPNSFYTYNPTRNKTTPRNTMLHHQQPLQNQPFQHHPRFPYNNPATMYAPMMMNFGGGGCGGSSGGGPAESSSEDLNLYQSNNVRQTSVVPQSSRKRFRTKFTQEQKDKMMEFAEKLGWKMVKQDEEVQQFCSQVGVKRQVFKVWMHNNKQGSKKKQNEE